MSNIYFKAFLIWLVPMILSFAFYDQNGALVGNYFVFKVVMALGIIATTYFTFRNYYKSHSDWFKTARVIIIVNIILDLIILIGLLKMPITEWVINVLTFYIVLIPGISYWLASRSKSQK